MRYDYERVGENYTANKYNLSTGLASNVQTATYKDHMHFSQITPKFTLSQQISANKMVYASIARGYKAGGYNVTSTTQKLPASIQNTIGITKLEQSWLSLWNSSNRMSLFYIDWKHQQVTTTVPGVGNIINNAGHSNSKGSSFRQLIVLSQA